MRATARGVEAPAFVGLRHDTAGNLDETSRSADAENILAARPAHNLFTAWTLP